MHPIARSAIATVAMLATATAVTACGSNASTAAVAPAKTATTPPSSAAAATTTAGTPAAQSSTGGVSVIGTHNTQDGMLITGVDGRTVYYFQPDKKSSAGHAKSSTCYNACATVWPPVLATTTSASGSAKASLIGLTKRTDGTTQVTYNGLPLYYYAADLKAGQVTGNHLRDGFGFWGALLANGHDTPSS